MSGSIESLTDLELLERWRAGDRAAGSALFKRHVGWIERYFGSRVDCDVDDLVQSTFEAFLNHERFDGRARGMIHYPWGQAAEARLAERHGLDGCRLMPCNERSAPRADA